MKKLSLRMLAVLMVALMVFGLAACGGSGDSGDDSGEAAAAGKGWTEVKKSLPASASGKTLRVYDWTKEKEYYGLEKANQDFTKETGIKVDFKQIPYDTYFTKINAEANAQNAPDVVRVQNGTRKEMTYLQPINKATKFDFTDAAWDQSTIEHYTYGDNIYAVSMKNAPVYSPYVMFYNEKLIKDYNLDDPYKLWQDDVKNKTHKWNWDKVWEMCEEFKEEVDDDAYSPLTTMAGFEYFHAVGKPPVKFNRKTLTFSHNMGDQTFIKTMQKFVDKSKKDGLIDKQLSNASKFSGGKILFYVSMGQLTVSTSDMFKGVRKNNALACVPLPSFNENTEDVQVMGEVMALGIPKTAKNADLAPYYMRYTLDREHYDMSKYYNCNHAEETLQYIAEKGANSGYAGYVMTPEEFAGNHTNTVIDEFRGSGSENTINRAQMYTPLLDAACESANKFYQNLAK